MVILVTSLKEIVHNYINPQKGMKEFSVHNITYKWTHYTTIYHDLRVHLIFLWVIIQTIYSLTSQILISET
ncbi:protein of unknown function [Clostridium beijerinckii]|nr:protein of unknown function [Clostridium beijerinckii]